MISTHYEPRRTNLQIAKAYLAGSDNGITTRTWRNAVESLIGTKHGANQHRWKTAAKDKAFAMLVPQVIIETKAETILKVLQMGTVSTNVYLRRLHNFCVDMNWLPYGTLGCAGNPGNRFQRPALTGVSVTGPSRPQSVSGHLAALKGL